MKDRIDPFTGRASRAAILTEAPAGSLWDAAPVRASDPETSHQAARRLTESGALVGRRREVWQALHDRPGATAGELAEALGWERGEVSKRLPELERMNSATRGPARECRVKGSTMATWTAQRLRLNP